MSRDNLVMMKDKNETNQSEAGQTYYRSFWLPCDDQIIQNELSQVSAAFPEYEIKCEQRIILFADPRFRVGDLESTTDE